MTKKIIYRNNLLLIIKMNLEVKKDTWSDSMVEISKMNGKYQIHKYFRFTMKEYILRRYHELHQILNIKGTVNIPTDTQITINENIKMDIHTFKVNILPLTQEQITETSYIEDKKSKNYGRVQLISSPPFIEGMTLNNKRAVGSINFGDQKLSDIVGLIQDMLEIQLWCRLELHPTNIKVMKIKDGIIEMMITDIGNITYKFIQKNKKLVLL